MCNYVLDEKSHLWIHLKTVHLQYCTRYSWSEWNSTVNFVAELLLEYTNCHHMLKLFMTKLKTFVQYVGRDFHIFMQWKFMEEFIYLFQCEPHIWDIGTRTGKTFNNCPFYFLSMDPLRIWILHSEWFAVKFIWPVLCLGIMGEFFWPTGQP